MAFTKVFTVLAMAFAIASAAPQVGGTDSADKTVGSVMGKCNAQQIISCCNSSGLLGLNCLEISALISVPINQACNNPNQVACCEKTDQTGLINLAVQCNPIAV